MFRFDCRMMRWANNQLRIQYASPAIGGKQFIGYTGRFNQTFSLNLHSLHEISEGPEKFKMNKTDIITFETSSVY